MTHQTKSTELRLVEVIEIYAKLREARVFDDPGLRQLKQDCQNFVRASAAAGGGRVTYKRSGATSNTTL